MIYVVGMGPGKKDMMTAEAAAVIDECDVIAGYKTYTALIRDIWPDKEYYENGMRGEIERCRKCAELSVQGKNVALICSGDAGVYGMASPMIECAVEAGLSVQDVTVVSGVTAALSGAALLGAPVNHDFCLISLSDLLTPWETIERRLLAAAEGDFAIVLYNPASAHRPDHLKRAVEILMRKLDGDTCCGYVVNIGREGESSGTCTLKDLLGLKADMFTTVFIGNSRTYIRDNRLITPRGYALNG